MAASLRRPLTAIALAVGCITWAQAGPYSDLVVFGDSLTDTGNVLALTLAFGATPFPNFPGAPGRFSNGPAWIEYLAAGLGDAGDAAPARLLFNGASVIPIGAPGGNNYAYGGARTGLGGSAGATTGLIGQLINWNGSAFGGSLTRAADPNALYVVVAGANDLRDARSANPGNTPADDAARSAAAATVATNVTNVVGLLAQAGARHFLVSNLPDLGKTPEAALLGVTAASTDITLKFNTALDSSMAQLDSFFDVFFQIDLDIRELDFHGLVDTVFNNPAAFGVTNTNAPCINPVAPGAYYFPGSTDVNCNVSLFSDPLHPSALAHRLVGEAALRVALPEPQSILLVALAGLALLTMSRRRVG